MTSPPVACSGLVAERVPTTIPRRVSRSSPEPGAGDAGWNLPGPRAWVESASVPPSSVIPPKPAVAKGSGRAGASARTTSGSASERAIPKSSTFTSPSGVTMMLSALRSR